MIPNCAVTRHVEFHLDGSSPAVLPPLSLEDWPDVTWQVSETAKRVDLDTLTPEIVQSWQPGDRLLLSGKLLTGRDAAHKRIQELLESGQYHEALEARYRSSVASAGNKEEYERRLANRQTLATLLVDTLEANNLDALVYPTLRVKYIVRH